MPAPITGLPSLSTAHVCNAPPRSVWSFVCSFRDFRERSREQIPPWRGEELGPHPSRASEGAGKQAEAGKAGSLQLFAVCWPDLGIKLSATCTCLLLLVSPHPPNGHCLAAPDVDRFTPPQTPSSKLMRTTKLYSLPLRPATQFVPSQSRRPQRQSTHPPLCSAPRCLSQPASSDVAGVSVWPQRSACPPSPHKMAKAWLRVSGFCACRIDGCNSRATAQLQLW